MAIAHHAMRVWVNHLAGGGGEGGRGDRGLGGGVRRLAGHTQHHGGRLLGGVWRQLEVSSHEGVVRGHGSLDGRGYSYDGGLHGHAVAEGWRLGEGVGVGQKAGLAHRSDWWSPGWTWQTETETDRQKEERKEENNQLKIQLFTKTQCESRDKCNSIP